MAPEPKASEHTLASGTSLPLPPTEKDQVISGTSTPTTHSAASIKNDKEDVNQVDKHDNNSLDRVKTHEEYATGTRLVPIILALVLAVFLIALDMTIVGTAIPKITDEFHGLNQVPWYGSAYFMTFGGFQPATGKLFKYFPLKITFLIFIAIFEIGSLICGVAQDSTTFIVGRAIAGVGAAGVGTGALTITAIAPEPKMRPAMTGLTGAVYGLSSVLGPILGGTFADKVTWRWCFYINLPIGGLSIVLVTLFFRTPPQAQPAQATWKEKLLQLDMLGISLVMGGIISFILACQYGGQTHAWGSSTVVGLLVGSVLIWITFIIWEYFQKGRAMIEWRLFRLRTNWQPAWFQFFFAGSYFVALYYLPIYFQSVANTSAIRSGVLNLPLVLAITAGSIFSGAIATKTGQCAPLQFVGACVATVAAGLMYTYDLDTGLGKWVGYQFLSGLAIGFGFMMGLNIAQASAKPEDISSVTALVMFFQTLGGAVAISAAQSGFVNRILTTLKHTAPQINPQLVIATGATEIRNVFPADQIDAVVDAYMEGIKVTLALMVALMGFSVIMGLFVPRHRLNTHALKEAGAIA